MVRRKYLKRKPKRRFRKRKSKVLSNGPLSIKMKTRMRYNECVSITPVTSQSAGYVFRCNSLMDPNATGVGHQPRGYDQLMTLYDHYTVIGAKITARIFNSSTQPATIGIAIKDESTPYTDPEDYMESRVLTTRTLGARGAGEATNATLSMAVNPNKFLGISNPLASAFVRGGLAVNPAEMCYFHIFAYDPSGDTPGTISIDVTIDFTAVLTEPKQPTKS